MLGQGRTIFVFSQRALSTSLWPCANHYDVLGVTPKSSQGDIKTAYYKLSKIYHPDKSPDEAAAKKFRALTEAYEVLGNVKLKKMYDKGLLVGGKHMSRMTPEAEPEPTDPTLKFYKSRVARTTIPTMDGKTPIYNFDAWAKSHYSDLYEKTHYDRAFVKRKRENQNVLQIAEKRDITMLVMFILCGIAFMLVLQGSTNYDQNQITQNQNSLKENDEK